VRFYDTTVQPLEMSHGGAPETGEYEQQVTIEDFFHERIDVPSIGDTRRATVLHDFNRVRQHSVCLSVCLRVSHCLIVAVSVCLYVGRDIGRDQLNS